LSIRGNPLISAGVSGGASTISMTRSAILIGVIE
jgi:hypothetical protein